jgi:hypothetical protein
MPFASGQSGNPNGAPRRPHKRTAHIRALVRDKAGVLVKKTLANAEAGDVESLRLFYRYLMPRHHFVPEPVDLPPAKDLVEARLQIGKLASLTAEGVLDLDSMTAISRTLALAAGLRLEELEEILADKEVRNHDDD